MEDIYLNTIQDFNDYQGIETLHPLVSVVRVESTDHIKETCNYLIPKWLDLAMKQIEDKFV